MMQRGALLFLLTALLSGCQCQLSGTPLDTMEKQLNPACWCAARSDTTTADPTPAPAGR